jgi:hypothetical protein
MESRKSPEMESILNKLANECFGRSRTGKKCVTCGSTAVKAEDFRDDISRKEYSISMMCQCCQDQFFGHLLDGQ